MSIMDCKRVHRNYKAIYKLGHFHTYVCLDCGEYFDFVR